MEWLFLLIALEFGYIPTGHVTMFEQDRGYSTKETFYGQLDAEIQMDIFYVGASIKTFMKPKSGKHAFSPERVDYWFRLGMRYKSIEIGFRHLCVHPIVYTYIDVAKPLWGGVYEEVFIRLSNERAK